MKIFTWLRNEHHQPLRGEDVPIQDDALLAGLLGFNGVSAAGRNKRRFTLFQSSPSAKDEIKQKPHHFRSKSSASSSTSLTFCSEESNYSNGEKFDLTCIDPTWSEGTSATPISLINFDQHLAEQHDETRVIATLSELLEDDRIGIIASSTDSVQGLSCIMEENSMDISQDTTSRFTFIGTAKVEAFEPFDMTFTESVEWEEYANQSDSPKESDIHIVVENNHGKREDIQQQGIYHTEIFDLDAFNRSSDWTAFDTAASVFEPSARESLEPAEDVPFAEEGLNQTIQTISHDDMVYSKDTILRAQDAEDPISPVTGAKISDAGKIEAAVFAEDYFPAKKTSSNDDTESTCSSSECSEDLSPSKNEDSTTRPCVAQNDEEFTVVQHIVFDCSSLEETKENCMRVKVSVSVIPEGKDAPQRPESLGDEETQSDPFQIVREICSGAESVGDEETQSGPFQIVREICSRALRSCCPTEMEEKEKDVHAIFGYVASAIAPHTEEFQDTADDSWEQNSEAKGL